MLSPFPGMDPYLEMTSIWLDVHHNLISTIRAQLNEQLRPRYRVGIQFRTIHTSNILGYRQPFLEITEVSTRDVVTVIEVVSPSNKIIGSAGRKSFIEKRREIMLSPIHWVEIDLLRGIRSIDSLMTGNHRVPHDYTCHVSPAELRPKGKIWYIRLDEPLPTIGIPLRSPDTDVGLQLQSVLANAYERAGYDLSIDYTQPAAPPLTKPQVKWAKTLLPKRKRK
jgi:hypothetical protein